MNRYFAFNTLARAIRSASNVNDGNTTAGRFDATYVSSCILLNASISDYFSIKAPFDNGASSITGLLCLRFDSNCPLPSNGGTFVTLYNAGANAYRIFWPTTTTVRVDYWNGTAWTAWYTAVTGPTTSLNSTYVLTLNINSSASLTVNGISYGSSSGAPTGAATAIDEIRFFSTNAASAPCAYSQIMGADYDLTSSHMYSKLVSGEGTYTDGTGTFVDVDDLQLNDGDAIGLPAVGNKHTFTKPSTTTVSAGLIIKSLGVNMRCRVGGGAVTDGKIKLRSGTTDTDSGNLSIGSAYSGRGYQFLTDPATGSPWAQSALDAAEIGAEAS